VPPGNVLVAHGDSYGGVRQAAKLRRTEPELIFDNREGTKKDVRDLGLLGRGEAVLRLHKVVNIVRDAKPRQKLVKGTQRKTECSAPLPEALEA